MQTYFGLKDATLSREMLISHAREAALDRTGSGGRPGFPNLTLDAKHLKTAYVRLSDSEPTPAGEWLLDNFHMLEKSIKEIENESFSSLSCILEGPFASLPRVYRTAVELVGHHEGYVDGPLIVDYLNAFQTDAYLTMRELRALRAMITTALVKLCSIESVECMNALRARERAESFVLKALQNPEALKKVSLDNPYFVERLAARLSEGALMQMRELDKRLAMLGVDVVSMAQVSHRAQVKSTLLIGNAITSLMMLSQIDWDTLFCSVSIVEKTLTQDPVYELMDATTRAYYRKCIESIAKKSRFSQVAVAREAVALRNGEGVRNHVGYYLCGAGQCQLYEKLGLQPVKGDGFMPFFGAIICVTLVLLLPLLAGRVFSVLMSAVICAFSVAMLLARRLIKRPARMLPRLKFEDGIPERYKTLIAVPVLISSAQKGAQFADKLEVHHFATRQNNVLYALIADLPPADTENVEGDAELIASTKARIAELNEKHGTIFFALFRKRNQNADGQWCGYERKRGALINLCELILGKNNVFDDTLPAGILYVLTLDADTVLPPETAKQLIGTIAHPLNSPSESKQGYGVIVPRIEITAQSAAKTPFAQLFGVPCGLDSYSCVAGELYHDLFSEGNYAGKGIFDVAAFYNAVHDIPDNSVLSHDLFEGCLARTGFAGDLTLFDDCPSSFAAYSARAHRWTRGDWQNLPFILGKGLSPLHRLKMIDNLRRSLVEAAVLALLFLAPFLNWGLYWVVLGVMALLGDLVFDFFGTLLKARDPRLKLFDAIAGLRHAAVRGLFTLTTLPYQAYLSLDAAIRALYRTNVSHKKMLEWVTAADSTNCKSVFESYKQMWIAPIFGIAAISLWSGVSLIALGVLWLFAPYISFLLSKSFKEKSLDAQSRAFLEDAARRYWLYFTDNATREHNFLPPDNLQEEPRKPVAARTSPTNIGMGLLAPYAAHSLGFIDRDELLNRVDNTLSTIEKLEKWHGQPYNWYETRTLRPLKPRFVSSVDNGNLSACYFTLREGLKGLQSKDQSNEKTIELCDRLDKLLEQMDFSVFYDSKVHLFYVGFDCTNGLNKSHYDLLASESRTLSLCAIAKGDIEAAHWFRLARPLTTVEGKRLLVSWNGTMFEYLMSEIFARSVPGTLLYESAQSCVAAQKNYAKDLPWGISESGFYEFDLAMNYQYRAFGIPGAGVKVTRRDNVIAPYASMLALTVDPQGACENLKKLKELGVYGRYGFYEALDATVGRVKPPFAIVKSYMAHHQGMSLLAICNAICSGAIHKAFAAANESKAVELLLTEREPEKSVVIRDYNRALSKPKPSTFAEVDTVQRTLRGANIQSAVFGDAVQLLVYSDGRTRASWRDIELYRTNLDCARPSQGFALHIIDKTGAQNWNLADADALFETGKAVFIREVNGVKTKMELCTPLDPCEVRRVEVINGTDRAIELELSAYIEISLCTAAEDNAHKAFHKLFIESEMGENFLTFIKRGKTPLYICAQWSGSDVHMGNDRMEVLDRDARVHLRNDGLSFKKTPIDPCAMFMKSVRLEAGETFACGIALCIGDIKEDVIQTAREFCDFSAYERAFTVAHSSSQVKLRYLGVSGRLKAFRNAAGILYAPGATRNGNDAIVQNHKNREDIWRLGISCDLPIVLYEIKELTQMRFAKEAIAFHQFLQLHGFSFDLVIVDAEPPAYEMTVREQLLRVLAIGASRGSVHVLREQDIENELTLLRALATIRWQDEAISEQIPAMRKLRKAKIQGRPAALAMDLPPLEHFNGFGGFDGSDYVIHWRENMRTPLPWSNILASESFGTIVTESGGGYTWARNSRENKLTPWSDDPVLDTQGEIFFLRDEASLRCTSLTPMPLPEGEYIIRHSRGFTSYSCGAQSVYQTLTVFVDSKKSVKAYIIKLKNPMLTRRELTIYYVVEWVLGAGGKSPLLHCEKQGDALVAYCGAFGPAYIATPGNTFTFTTSRENLCAALGTQGSLSGALGVGSDCCGAIAVPVCLEAGEEKQLVVLLGYEEQENSIAQTCAQFASVYAAHEAFTNVVSLWHERLSVVQVCTRDKAFDKMVNGMLLYQTWSARLNARAGFYQAGGAIGFRDQLQDVLAVLIASPLRAKKQLLLAAAHQFEDGDVQHWWHPPARGVRTFISDDMLFLPFVTMRYVSVTGDDALWDIVVPYLKNATIPEDKHDLYFEAEQSEQTGTIYEHCLRAIGRVQYGEHGLPRMGTGDWNDGMDNVKGESIWLAWFLYDVLNGMSRVADVKNDPNAMEFSRTARELFVNIEKYGWDGEWYLRAYFDSGQKLGSSECSECRIDSISQSWSVLSGGSQKRSRKAMESLEHHLIDRQNGIIKLLDPPFDKQLPSAGYIQNYIPGVRENGGQYTHAAVWAVLAMIRLGEYKKASEMISMLNPIRHSDNQIIAQRYKGEPYALAADVYAGDHAGRVGWTWYTGAAAWLYIASLELLGFVKHGDSLELCAAAADAIGPYTIEYRFGGTHYTLSFTKDGGSKVVPLVDDGGHHIVMLP